MSDLMPMHIASGVWVSGFGNVRWHFMPLYSFAMPRVHGVKYLTQYASLLPSHSGYMHW